MASLEVYSNSNIRITRFDVTQQVTLKFYQPSAQTGTEGNYYYRLKCTGSGLPNMYLYLGRYKTNTKYIYTHTFNVIDVRATDSLVESSFETLFTQFNTSMELRFDARLQASSSNSFPSSATAESQNVIIDFELVKSLYFAPSWSIPTHIDLNAGVAGIATLTGNDDQKCVQSASRLQITFPEATPKFGTSIAEYRISAEGGFSFTYTTNQIHNNPVRVYDLSNYKNLSGSVKFTFYVEDTRGMSWTLTKYIDIIPYSRVALTFNNTHRIGGTGSTVKLDFAGQWHGSPLTLSCTQIVAKDETTQTILATLTNPPLVIENDKFSYTANWENVSFDKEKSYSITATFTDLIFEVDSKFTIPVGTPVLSIRDKKVGINNSQPQSALDVNGVIQQNGLPVMGYMGEIGTAESCDFNDYTETGFYFYNGNSAQISHSPSGFSKTHKAVLKVIKIDSAHIVQRLYNFNLNTSTFRTRDNTWKSW